MTLLQAGKQFEPFVGAPRGDDAGAGGGSNTHGATVDALRRSSKSLEQVFAHYRELCGKRDPTSECVRLIAGRGPPEVEDLLAGLPPAWADYAIACVYAVLLPCERRRELGVFFTPPHLVEHLLCRMRAFGLDPVRNRIRDPSAGGAAFLVPLAREMALAWRTAGLPPSKIVARLRTRLRGREIDPGLVAVANALLRRMLVREIGCRAAAVADLSIVEVGDSLQGKLVDRSEHELGNPPYLRLNAAAQRRWRAWFADIASGRLNLYTMFVRRALDEVPPGGLVGHIVPASFLCGPEFRAFRHRIMQLADVLVLDGIEKRTNVFLDVVQDACFVVVRRRQIANDKPGAMLVPSGVLRKDGGFVLSGEAVLLPDGGPWSLPGCVSRRDTVTLADYGYRGTVGHLVANREPHRLHRRQAKGRVALAWAKCVTAEGRFDFDRGRNAKKAGGRGFVTVSDGATYVIRVPCVVLQRTSSSNQSRRLIAAAVPEDFLRRHGGIVGENHVILLVPTRADALPAAEMAEILNGPEANAAMVSICGSASISVRVLEGLPLPVHPSLQEARTP